jgi:hypothetical protein
MTIRLDMDATTHPDIGTEAIGAAGMPGMGGAEDSTSDFAGHLRNAGHLLDTAQLVVDQHGEIEFVHDRLKPEPSKDPALAAMWAIWIAAVVVRLAGWL